MYYIFLITVSLLFSTSAYSITDEALQTKIFSTTSDQLGLHCASHAAKHCGKLSRSMMINKSEFSCLYKLSTRLTRNGIPGFDGSKCDRTIRNSVLVAKAEEKALNPIAAEIYSVQRRNIDKHCSAVAAVHCGKTSRDMRVSRSEFSCLYSLTTRLTKNAIAGLDGSQCDRIIKNSNHLISLRKNNLNGGSQTSGAIED
jgi:hypothetical protein